ncbi:MAG: AAA family ATPase [Paramuribaculum sp.]|nr:AAA family ATPase [Paramuribaculum sp.]
MPINIDKYVSLLTKYKNIILHGAPGTGKTTIAKAIAKQLQAEEGFVQFHPSYDYTDFVEGLRPFKNDGSKEIGFRHKNGIFKEFCKKALEDPETNYVFIIDEINRGDISKIFGELFFAIDPGYSGEEGKVQTQYQNIIEDGEGWEDGFYVPANVYIVGTMNDIDRSVESLDFAMHRRFRFVEVTAEESADNMRIGKTEREAMLRLNEAIMNTPNLGTDFQIGASYFKDSMDAAERWEMSLKRLLKEYLRGIDRNGDKFKALENAYFGNTDADE